MAKLKFSPPRRQDHLRRIRIDAIEEIASAIRARRWAKLLALAARHRREQDGSA